jgi:hypothetical protein
MNARERQQEFLKKWARSGPRIFGIVEDGYQYSYHSITAISFAVWSKCKKDKGQPMLFKEFYDQLSREEKSEIIAKKYINERV